MEHCQTIADCLSRLSARLAPITETPRLEAEMLLAHGLGIARASLLARLRETTDVSCVEPLLAKRLDHQPLAYIFGEWEFYGLAFHVHPPLLTPRPETEHLVEAALRFLTVERKNIQPSPCLADLCCGTGCVAVTIARHAPETRVYACDIREDAVQTTLQNAQRHNAQVQSAQGDLFSPLDPLCPCFDAVVANPPYVPEGEWDVLSPVITKHEDRGALVAGVDGLEIIRRIIREAHPRLFNGGLLALELGENQFDAAAALMANGGFGRIASEKDLAGKARIITARRMG